MIGVIAVVVIILFLIIIIPAAIFGIGPFIKKHTNLKINFCIIFGYLAVLFLLSLVCLILPRDALVKSEKTSQISDTNDAYSLFDKKAAKGDFSVPSGFTKTEKSFAPQGCIVNVMTYNYDAVIITMTKGVDAPDNRDGKIDVYCYTIQNAHVSGTNMTFNTQVRAITYNDNNIKITSDIPHSIGLYEFADYYTTSQFIKQGSMINVSSPSFNTVVVILPRGVKVNETGSSTG